MRYFFGAFAAFLSVQLRRWKTWVIVLLLPCCTGLCALLLPPRETAAPVQVGVVLPIDGGEEFWQLLQERSGTVVTFLQTDEETLRRKVASAQWDCGLLLPRDFEERTERLDTDGLIELYIAQGSAAYPLVQETVSACLIRLLSDEIAQDYLDDASIAFHGTLTSQVENIAIGMTTADGTPLDAISLSADSSDKLIFGVLAILLLVWAMLAAQDLGKWLCLDSVRRLCAVRSVTAVLCARLAAMVLPVLTGAAAAACLLRTDVFGLLCLICYVLLLSSFVLLLARISPLQAALSVLMPFVPVVSLVLSPVIFDISLWSKPLGAVSRFLPVSLYLRAGDGEPAALLVMLGVAIVLSAGSIAMDLRGKKT